MRIDQTKEYWVKLISKEGDEAIGAGVPTDRVAILSMKPPLDNNCVKAAIAAAEGE